MKLFDFLKVAQEKVDDLQKKIENDPFATLSNITKKEPIQPKHPKPDLSVDGISKQILAQRNSLERSGFKEYEFIANRDCCGICARLNGKHFPISKIKIGVNAPPMHDGCRCCIAAYEDNDDYEAWLDHLANGGTTAAWKQSKKKKK